jgi:hypothetical protein
LGGAAEAFAWLPDAAFEEAEPPEDCDEVDELAPFEGVFGFA